VRWCSRVPFFFTRGHRDQIGQRLHRDCRGQRAVGRAGGKHARGLRAVRTRSAHEPDGYRRSRFDPAQLDAFSWRDRLQHVYGIGAGTGERYADSDRSLRNDESRHCRADSGHDLLLHRQALRRRGPQRSEQRGVSYGDKPRPPTNLTAQAGVGNVMLSWTASSGATGYNVYQSTTAGGEPAVPVLSGVTSPLAKVGSLTPGMKYYFTVKAVAYSFTGASSNEASAIAGIAAPANLTAHAGNSGVSLTWAAARGAASYNVYSGTAAGGESMTPVMSGITNTSVTLSELTPNTTYYFVTRSVAGSATSTPSNEVSAVPTSPPLVGGGGGGGGGGGLDMLSLIMLALIGGRDLQSRLRLTRHGS
jgi:hypothetical protein